MITLCVHVLSRAHLGMQRPIALYWLNEMINKIKELWSKVEPGFDSGGEGVHS